MAVTSIAYAALLACLTLPAATPGTLAARLQTLAGADAQDCGSVDAGADRAPALECANRALAGGKPFRVALQLSDRTSWQAAARDAQGRLWAVFYEPAADGAGPTLSVLLCRTLAVTAQNGDDALDCAPTLDPH